MKKWVALLRGINVSGAKKVPMKDLKLLFEKIGFINVKTFLATGNVVFEGKDEDLNRIEPAIEKTFGFSVDTIILPFKKITQLISSEPFKDINVTPKTRLYVSFYKELKESKLKLPFETEDESFKILNITNIAIISVLDLEKTGTIEGMKVLEKEYGKKLTTRNFNTVLKLLK